MMGAFSFKIIIPALLVIIAALPLFVGSYFVTFMILLFTYVILAESYDIVGGYLGYMNMGHSAFFGVGAYSFGLFLNSGLGVPLSLLLTALITTAFAALISYPFFRLRGAYYALATFGLIKLLELLAFNLKGLTGGSEGLTVASGYRIIPVYYMAFILCLATIYTVYRISKSKLGLAMVSIREDEEVAGAFGINTYRCKATALIISSIFAGLMGGLYIWNIIFINPTAVFGLEIALVPIAMALLGGSGAVIGPIVGAIFLTLVEELLWTKVPYLHLAVYGMVIAFVGLFMSGGLVRTKWAENLLGKLGWKEE
jgi:branched-chain amino acid transport system permease protein